MNNAVVRLSIETLVEELAAQANRPNNTARLVKLLSSTSPRDQQNLTRLALRFLSAIAENEPSPANEVAVKVAREIKAIDCCRYSCGHPGRSILDKELP